MLVIIWEYQVRVGEELRFEDIYGPEGEWVKLFRRSSGFVRTELLRHEHVPGRYATLDYWNSADAFAEFQRNFQKEYVELDERCGPLTSLENLVGQFNTIV
jgi:heme-degrading monooxygenase HmoA